MPIMRLLIVCSVFVVAPGMMLFGYLLGYGHNVRRTMREAGWTGDNIRLYRRAGDLLNRLVTVTDLDGVSGSSIIEPGLRTQIDAWLVEYRETLEKKK